MNVSKQRKLEEGPRWNRQLFAVMRLEWRRRLFNARGVWIVLLAFAPPIIVALHIAFSRLRGATCSIDRDVHLVHWMLILFELRVAIYFGMLGILVQSFRGEMVDKTLHYALIAPLRRETLLLGKFLASSLGGVSIFSAGVITCFVLLGWHHGEEGAEYLRYGGGLRHLGGYLGIMALGCFGYGAVFLLLNHAFRNPVLAAAAYFGWETVSALFPELVQLLSVTYYLKPLFPVELPNVGISGLLTVAVEPMAPLLAIAGLVMVSVVVVTAVAVRFRGVEIDSAD